jgi:hypothetical protein
MIVETSSGGSVILVTASSAGCIVFQEASSVVYVVSLATEEPVSRELCWDAFARIQIAPRILNTPCFPTQPLL